jgi:hypothetical protein
MSTNELPKRPPTKFDSKAEKAIWDALPKETRDSITEAYLASLPEDKRAAASSKLYASSSPASNSEEKKSDAEANAGGEQKDNPDNNPDPNAAAGTPPKDPPVVTEKEPPKSKKTAEAKISEFDRTDLDHEQIKALCNKHGLTHFKPRNGQDVTCGGIPVPAHGRFADAETANVLKEFTGYYLEETTSDA